MNAVLIVLTEGGDPQRIALDCRRPLSVGRAADNDIVVDHPTVSERHARLTCTDGAWLLKDLGSSNGTLVDNVPCEEIRLVHGNLLSFGEARIRFEVPGVANEAALPSAPAPEPAGPPAPLLKVRGQRPATVGRIQAIPAGQAGRAAETSSARPPVQSPSAPESAAAPSRPGEKVRPSLQAPNREATEGEVTYAAERMTAWAQQFAEFGGAEIAAQIGIRSVRVFSFLELEGLAVAESRHTVTEQRKLRSGESRKSFPAVRQAANLSDPAVPSAREKREGTIKLVVPGSAIRVDCPKCSGQGKARCPDCGGKGRIHPCPRCGGAGRHTCPFCQGRKRTADSYGNLSDTPCSFCGGRGIRDCGLCREFTARNEAVASSVVKGGPYAFEEVHFTSSKSKGAFCTSCGATGVLHCPDCEGAGVFVDEQLLVVERKASVFADSIAHGLPSESVQRLKPPGELPLLSLVTLDRTRSPVGADWDGNLKAKAESLLEDIADVAGRCVEQSVGVRGFVAVHVQYDCGGKGYELWIDGAGGVFAQASPFGRREEVSEILGQMQGAAAKLNGLLVRAGGLILAAAFVLSLLTLGVKAAVVGALAILCVYALVAAFGLHFVQGAVHAGRWRELNLALLRNTFTQQEFRDLLSKSYAGLLRQSRWLRKLPLPQTTVDVSTSAGSPNTFGKLVGLSAGALAVASVVPAAGSMLGGLTAVGFVLGTIHQVAVFVCIYWLTCRAGNRVLGVTDMIKRTGLYVACFIGAVIAAGVVSDTVLGGLLQVLAGLVISKPLALLFSGVIVSGIDGAILGAVTGYCSAPEDRILNRWSRTGLFAAAMALPNALSRVSHSGNLDQTVWGDFWGATGVIVFLALAMAALLKADGLRVEGKPLQILLRRGYLVAIVGVVLLAVAAVIATRIHK